MLINANDAAPVAIATYPQPEMAPPWERLALSALREAGACVEPVDTDELPEFGSAGLAPAAGAMMPSAIAASTTGAARRSLSIISLPRSRG